MEYTIRTDMEKEISEKILYLPYKYLRYVLLFVRGLSRNDDEPQNVQEGGDSSAER